MTDPLETNRTTFWDVLTSIILSILVSLAAVALGVFLGWLLFIAPVKADIYLPSGDSTIHVPSSPISAPPGICVPSGSAWICS